MTCPRCYVLNVVLAAYNAITAVISVRFYWTRRRIKERNRTLIAPALPFGSTPISRQLGKAGVYLHLHGGKRDGT
jgi:hypothetical protein